MGNTIGFFLDKYYKYGVDPDPERQRLTIGGFKSAFLADLEASYIFDKLKYIWERHVQFQGTYRDDQIIMFNGQKSDVVACQLAGYLPTRSRQASWDSRHTVHNGNMAPRQYLTTTTNFRGIS
jgi:hypothetical protein